MKADPVTSYARKVLAGQIVANRLVRQACARHLADLEQAAAKGLEWRPEAAQMALDFFPEVLCFPENTDAGEEVDEDAPPAADLRPFVLQPWQQFIVGSLFGWYTTKGFRRFREAYIETAKGSGKTVWGAGVMLYLLVADGQRGAQVYAAAVNRDQAGVSFRDAVRMVDASPYLRDLLEHKVNNLALIEDGSYFRPVSAEKRGLDGKRVHGALVDELHEHATPVVVNKMRAGTKGMRNALIVKITNSGFDRTSVCWNHHDYSRKVLEGTVTNETWFAFVCGLDPCAACVEAGKWFPSDDCSACDDWRVEGPHWLKANPNLGVSLPWQYVRERVAQAQGMPSEVSDVLRFNFCVWTQGTSRAVDMGRWASCQPMPPASDLVGARCFGGLDLGETDDFTAWARIWVLDDGRVAVKMRYWLPSVALERYPNRPYGEWQRRKILTVTEGDVTNYEAVRQTMIEDCKADGIEAVGYDPHSAVEMSQKLIGQGIDMVPITQGYPLGDGIKRVLELITDGLLCHEPSEVDPILGWMASNVVLQTNIKTGQKRLAKERSPEKIDGFAALVDAVEWGIVRHPPTVPKPTYSMFVFGGHP